MDGDAVAGDAVDGDVVDGDAVDGSPDGTGVDPETAGLVPMWTSLRVED